jgi:hypothetical protein
MTDFVTGAITSIASLLLGLVGHIVWENYQEKQKARNETLKNHFKQLEASAIKPMGDTVRGIANDGRGSLSIKGASCGSRSYAYSLSNFEQGEFYIFKLHFPEQAEKTTKLLNQVNEHNKLSESFTNKLKGLIEEKTELLVREGKGRPFIYTNVPFYLRQILCDLAEAKSLGHDFRNAEIEKPNNFYIIRTTSTIYAEVTTQEEANSCKRGLIKLMESIPLQKETSRILERAKEVENEAGSIANLLDFICWQYRETRQLLNEEKGCPYCQVIFHPKRSKLEAI